MWLSAHLGSLRRRFVVLLGLLGLLALVPWTLSVGLHDHLEGLGKRLELASTLRYQTMDLSALLRDPEVGGVSVAAVVTAQRRLLDLLVDGNPDARLPPCPNLPVCRRLERHRQHWAEEVAPAAARLSGADAEAREAFARALFGELTRLDGTVHLLAESAESQVDGVMAAGLVSLLASVGVLLLVGFGVGEVFSRIRRLREAAADPPSMEELLDQSGRSDEVAALARSLHASIRGLQQRNEADRLRAAELDAQQRALRTLAAGLNDWIGGKGRIEDALAKAAGPAGFQDARLQLGAEAGEASPGDALARVPLTWGEQSLGTFELRRSGEALLQPEEGALIEAFARTLSLALVARDLLEERDARSRMAAWLSTLRDLGEGSAMLWQHVRELLDHDEGLVSVLDESGQVEECWRSRGGRSEAVRTDCGQELSDEVGLIDGTCRCAGLLELPEGAAILAIPLLVENRRVGLLLLARRTRAFLPRELDVARAIAPVLASTLERMRLTERLHMSEQLATVGGLSRMVAHEVRNPLNSLGLHMRLLEKALRRMAVDEGDQRQVSEHLGVLRGEIERLDQVVESYVALAAGRRSARFELADLRLLVKEIVAVHQPRAVSGGICFETELGSGPAEAVVDRLRFQQAVQNLVCNAIEAVEHQPGGHVRVWLDREGENWALHVCDSGPGLDDTRRIFTPGYTTKSAGSGMGLPISLQIARLHGGGLVARRPEAGGAEFVLTVAGPEAEAAVLTTA